ncbi:hypothetical protein [Muricoccus radiodurans]|uniref:hypothetical protein n=1 Tax=Muricoccus radiodurans TaxID=2231721 RepID=UPI003CF61A20
MPIRRTDHDHKDDDVTKTFLTAALPALALLSACASEPPPPPRAVGPEEAFRGVCEQRFPNAAPFGVSRCMYEELDRSRGVQPASTAEPEAAPAPARSSTRSSTRRRGR